MVWCTGGAYGACDAVQCVAPAAAAWVAPGYLKLDSPVVYLG